jgi:hypothetical protein
MILRDRFQLELTYAKQVTDDQIVQLPQPAVTGYSSQWFNTGQATGTTLEATLNAQMLSRGRFSWNTTVVADRPRSKISEWNRPCYFSTLRNICGGASLAEMWGERFLRGTGELPRWLQPNASEFQVNDDGYLVWVGPNGSWRDGKWGQFTTINGVRYEWGMPVLDRDSAGFTVVQKIGSSDPDVNLGWLNNVRYGNVNLHAHMHAQLGGNVYNNTRQRLYQHNRHRNIDQHGKADETKKTTAYYFTLYNRNNNTSEFVEDGTFLKLRALSLTYRMPKEQLTRLGLGMIGTDAMTFGVIGRNLLTLTEYTGFDPEVGSVLQRYDSFSWPNTRQLTFTLDVSF